MKFPAPLPLVMAREGTRQKTKTMYATKRITTAQLEALVKRLNISKGYNPDEYTDGKSNAGTYCISWAYGGCELQQLVNEGGATREISRDGHGTKRQLFNFLQNFK